MKYLYCYLGKFIEWETDKDRSLETYRYCDLTNVSRFSQRAYGYPFRPDISEVSLLSSIKDFRPGEMFLTDESLFNSYNHTTFNLSFSEYSDVLASLKVYRNMVFKGTGRFDKWKVSNDCVGVLDDYIIEKKRDLKIDLVLDFL